MQGATRPRVKYLLFPGFIWSKNDDQQHYISSPKLAELYGVSMRECMVYRHGMSHRDAPEDLIKLYPQANGDYTLPKGA